MVGLPLVLTWWAYDCHLCATKQEGHILDNSDGARCSSQAIARGILVGQRDALRNVSDFAEHANHGTLENRTFSCSQRWESYVVYFRLLSLVLRQLLCYRNFFNTLNPNSCIRRSTVRTPTPRRDAISLTENRRSIKNWSCSTVIR